MYVCIRRGRNRGARRIDIGKKVLYWMEAVVHYSDRRAATASATTPRVGQSFPATNSFSSGQRCPGSASNSCNRLRHTDEGRVHRGGCQSSLVAPAAELS